MKKKDIPQLEADKRWEDDKKLVITVTHHQPLQSLYGKPMLPFAVHPQDVLAQEDFIWLEITTTTQKVRISPIRGIGALQLLDSWQYRVTWEPVSGESSSQVLSFREICSPGGLLDKKGRLLGVISSNAFQKYECWFSTYVVVIVPA